MLANKRIPQIDYIKSLCIFLMVLCHYGLYQDCALLDKIIYGFHMPMLFMISGYLFKDKKPIALIKLFGIPILFFTLLKIVVEFCINIVHEQSKNNLIFLLKILLGFIFGNKEFCSPFTGYWFVIGLILTRFLFHFIKIEKYGFLLMTIAIIVSEMNNCFHISNMLNTCHLFKPFIVIPFIYIGYMIKEKRIRVNKVISIIFFILSLSFIVINNRIEMGDGNFGMSYILVLMTNTMLLISFINLINFKPVGIIKHISNGTLFILGTHNLLFPILINKLSNYINHVFSILIVITFYFILVIPIIAYLYKNYPLLLGKTGKKELHS